MKTENASTECQKGSEMSGAEYPRRWGVGGLKNSKNIQVTTSDIYPSRNFFKSRQKTILSY